MKTRRSILIERRQELKQRQTVPEKLFKLALKEMDVVHRCQYLVTLHRFDRAYILDFYLPEYRLAIEIDGHSHNSATQKTYDATRDKLLIENIYVKTVRFKNEEIHNHLINLHLINQLIKTHEKYYSISHSKVPHRIDTSNKNWEDFKR